MGSSIDTVQYVIDKVGLGRRLVFKKMFGEFALYLDGKIFALVCDDQLFLKPTDQGKAFLGKVRLAPPYPGAKNYYLITDELDDPDRLKQVVLVTASALPEPKPKAVKPASGNSGTPLAKKLGFKDGLLIYSRNAPEDYIELLQPLPSGVEFANRLSSRVDIVHLFASKRSALKAELSRLRRVLKQDASIWVSWPKKASKVPTDITEDEIRSIALPLGFVDIKVCAVSDIWSGLKLVVRKRLRTPDA